MERGFSGRFWSNFVTASALPAGITIGFASGSDEALFAGAAVGLAGGIGFIVDRVTGSAFDRDQHAYVIDLDEAR